MAPSGSASRVSSAVSATHSTAKKHRKSGRVMSAIGLNSLERHCETTMCRDGCKVHKKEAANSSEVSAHWGRGEPKNRLSCSYLVDKKRKLPLCEIPRIPADHVYQRLKNLSLPRVPVKRLDILAFSLRGGNIAIRTLVAVGDVVVGLSSLVEECSSILSSWCCVTLGSSVIDNMFSVLSFFLCPFVDIFRSSEPCIIVFSDHYVVHKLIQVVFPSLGGSSCFPLSSCRDDKSWVPLGSSSGPSFSFSCASFSCILSRWIGNLFSRLPI